MLIQNPSRIFVSGLDLWKRENTSSAREIRIGENSGLRTVTEAVIDENGSFHFTCSPKSSVLILVLYGEILIGSCSQPVSSAQFFMLKTGKSRALILKNNLPEEKADVLIIEMVNTGAEESFTTAGEITFPERNTLLPLRSPAGYPGFIGLYEGRKEGIYTVSQKNRSVFGMVINGAFEFQNRLLETRDALLIAEAETIEFEALSENALLILLEA